MPDARSSQPPSLTEAGELILVPTPIGNLGDISARATEALCKADLILAEDTRVSGRLLSALSISGRLAAFHDHNEERRTAKMLERIRAGQKLVLLADAGMPLISDPGFRLVRAVVSAGLPVSALPGPNAALLALVLSALPPLPFLFYGFLPPRRGARKTVLARIVAAERTGFAATLGFYEAPHRLAAMLADLAWAFGPRPAALARELTKVFEEIRRDTLPALAAHYANTPARGEVTVIVGPPEAPPRAGLEEIDRRLAAALARASLRDAVAEVAAASGLSRRALYARALALAPAAKGSS